jgi:hypothetical protein
MVTCVAQHDCVDALSAAYRLLTRRGSSEMKVHVPRGRIPLPRITAHPDSFGGFGGYGSGSRRVGDW